MLPTCWTITFVIRPATPDDVPTIAAFIRELADYERAPKMAVATDEQLREALFGQQPAVFAHLAVTDAKRAGSPAH